MGFLGELVQLESTPLANVTLQREEGPSYLVPGGELGGGKVEQLKENEKVLPRREMFQLFIQYQTLLPLWLQASEYTVMSQV